MKKIGFNARTEPSKPISTIKEEKVPFNNVSRMLLYSNSPFLLE
jgi:hypothetical protein